MSSHSNTIAMKNQLSLSFLLVTACLLCSITLEAQVSKTVNIAKAGTLPTLITKVEKDQITHLTVTGDLNGDDIRFIREMAGMNKYKQKTAGKLSVLDLKQANIVSGGELYCRDNFILGDSLGATHKTSDKVIGSCMFESCSGLTEISLPNSITSIDTAAFSGCTGLTSVTFSENLLSIGIRAFEKCTGLTSVTIPDKVYSIGVWAFKGCTGLTSLTLGNNVISIGDLAFDGCSGLTSVLIPNSVTSIKNRAFYGCSGLTSVTLGSGVTSIGNAFYYCKGLQEFRVSIKNESFCQVDGVLYNKDKTTLIVCPNTKTNEYTIPKSVTSIGNYAFSGCNKLTSIIIPKSVTSIGDYAFSRCDGLKQITIPNSVTSIGNGAFANSNGLKYITIPKSVSSIGSYVFSGTSIKMIRCEASTPPSLGRLKSLMLSDNENHDEYNAFINSCQLFVPKGASILYKRAPIWKEFSTINEDSVQEN